MGRAARAKREKRAPLPSEAEEEQWTPFRRAIIPGYVSEPGETIWKNSLYTVFFTKQLNQKGGEPYLLHLSIKRNDRACVRDWRAFQRIKNELVGPEQEMVEIYPAESRLVDTANQYHLWGLEGEEIGIGFASRLVSDAHMTPFNIGQRPFPTNNRPADAVVIEEELILAQNRAAPLRKKLP